jgi:sugar (glycoside-pentoside-hexuronide) transporter
MKPLSMRTKIGYGLGDLASNFLFQLTVIYLLFFYTDILKISAISAGMIFLGARVWDAINDPMMGLLVDHTKSKHGKARVYLLYGSLPLAIATVLMFQVPGFSEGGRIVYALVTYILWGMLYTLVNIPYSSMTASLTQDPQERTSLSSIRMIFMLIGVICVSVLVEPIVSSFDQPAAGYRVVAILFAILSFVFFQFCFLSTKVAKDHKTSDAESYSIREVWPILLKNGPLFVIAITSLFGSMASFIRETAAIYFVNYNVGRSEMLPVFLGVVVVSMVVGNLILPRVTERFDKKGAYYIGTVIAVIGSIVFHFIPTSNLPMIMIFAAISSVGFAIVGTLGWSMVPDTVEYGEYKTGVRTEGIIYAVFSFSQKLATAVAGLLVATVLETTDYVANAANQSPETLSGILSTLTIIPITLVVISAIAVHFYKIDRVFFSEIREKLEMENRKRA